MRIKNTHAFTLIEVLIALSILSIAITAMLKASANAVVTTRRVQEKTISQLIAQNAIAMIQLNLIKVNSGQTISKKVNALGQTWYWNAEIKSTPFPTVNQIIVKTSLNPTGPFQDAWMGYRTTAYE